MPVLSPNHYKNNISHPYTTDNSKLTTAAVYIFLLDIPLSCRCGEDLIYCSVRENVNFPTVCTILVIAWYAKSMKRNKVNQL